MIFSFGALAMKIVCMAIALMMVLARSTSKGNHLPNQNRMLWYSNSSPSSKSSKTSKSSKSSPSSPSCHYSSSYHRRLRRDHHPRTLSSLETRNKTTSKTSALMKAKEHHINWWQHELWKGRYGMLNSERCMVRREQNAMFPAKFVPEFYSKS